MDIPTAVIVDDEQPAIATLEWELARTEKKVEVIKSFTNPEEALAELDELQPDILFLDIEMPEMDGFSLLKELGSDKYSVIFITAYDQYAIEAFRHSAIDYILKPVDITELNRALARFEESQASKITAEQMAFLFNKLESNQQSLGKVALPSSNGLLFAKVETIIHCESDSNYTIVHFTEGTKHVICRTLREIEEILSGQGFMRVHNSHLVNLRNVTQYVKSDGGYLILDNGAHITISRSKKEEISKLFT